MTVKWQRTKFISCKLNTAFPIFKAGTDSNVSLLNALLGNCSLLPFSFPFSPSPLVPGHSSHLLAGKSPNVCHCCVEPVGSEEARQLLLCSPKYTHIQLN